MKMCKKDLLKYFNLSKKAYLAKFKKKTSNIENKFFFKLLEHYFKEYIDFRIKEIDKKTAF